jgi:hypothetical protein
MSFPWEQPKPFNMVPATITSGSTEISFYISTIKLGDRVLVKLDKVRA